MEKTVAKALRALEVLCESERPAALSALTRRLGLNKSNVHRLLGTLIELGYARRNEDATYEASLKIWELGQMRWSRHGLTHVAARHLDRLGADLDETVLLAILDQNDVLYIDTREAQKPIRLTASVGRRLQPHCSATGKLLLAFSEDEVGKLDGRPLQKYTRRTLTALPELRGVLDKVRQQGYALNVNELVDGLAGIAVPVRDSTGRVIAALGATLLSAQVSQKRVKEIVDKLRAASALISADLGWTGAPRAVPAGHAETSPPRKSAPARARAR
ncbi:MAG TPA: IclR family transcriptional regulator [Pseudolabrys sp.]|nr:IclR family transcriptional regulator [Pseudolabrys sp.]